VVLNRDMKRVEVLENFIFWKKKSKPKMNRVAFDNRILEQKEIFPFWNK